VQLRLQWSFFFIYGQINIRPVFLVWTCKLIYHYLYNTPKFSFFVLSGYLMCSFMRQQVVSIRVALEFYQRRIKRILPIYLLVIFSTLLISTLTVGAYSYHILKTDGLSAVLFFSNAPSFHRITYSQVLDVQI
jgi:peptidoglycan/LPS O-acetylase OafA/YrhL